ncbi:unnamed protein product [Lactuca saligna]|uniref:Uncharacterized protein n=1 Tax=Lactuca saligna TaxID=75948 RepID=A0AA35YND1_LACSI|nr:unnamed protein product [Lactuca saligna]
MLCFGKLILIIWCWWLTCKLLILRLKPEFCCPRILEVLRRSERSKKDVKASLSKPSPEQIEKVAKPTPKKIVKSDPPPKKVVKPIIKETSTHAKETMPSKSSILKRLKKMAHRPHHLPERAEDTVKRIYKKKKKPKVTKDLMEDIALELPFHDLDMGIPSLARGSPLKSNVEETSSPGGTVKVSNMDTTTNQGDSHLSTPKPTVVTPPGFSNTESFNEEVQTLDINVNISN